LINRRTFLGLSLSAPLLANEIINTTNDIYVSNEDWPIFVSALKRIKRLRRYVGFGNFNIISFDSALYYARNYSSIGAFSKIELDLLDRLFYEDPSRYGFYGKRTTKSITHKISKKDIVKIPKTGHYLYKGKPYDDYHKIRNDVGNNIILTSGIRGVVKQMSLYMKKIYSLKGNITQASFSLAPPAYTYHAISDFDVGKKGFGYANFTKKFITTKEFKSLKKLNYISMRYTINNTEGVRYEPWHIKII
jgi:D-alanyl-D-alanine carboxypeptidase